MDGIYLSCNLNTCSVGRFLLDSADTTGVDHPELDR